MKFSKPMWKKKEALFTIYDKAFRKEISGQNASFGSDFASCKINLWQDYLLFLAKHCVREGASTDGEIRVTETAQCQEGTEGSMLGYELMLTGAEYVTGGGKDYKEEVDGVNDMWKDPTDEHNNILTNLRTIFGERAKKRDILKLVLTEELGEMSQHIVDLKKHLCRSPNQAGQGDGGLADFIQNALGQDLASMKAEEVEEFAATVEQWGYRRKQMQCLCLATLGLGSMNEEQKSEYQSLCPSFAAEDINMSAEGDKVLVGADASGLKYKRLLVMWAYINKTLHDTGFKLDEQAFNDLKEFIGWYKETEWNYAEPRWLGQIGGTAVFHDREPTKQNALRLPPVYKYTQYKKTNWFLTLLSIIGTIIVLAALALATGPIGAGFVIAAIISGATTGLAIWHDVGSHRSFNSAIDRIAAPSIIGIFDLDGPDPIIPSQHDVLVYEDTESGLLGVSKTNYKIYHRYFRVPFNPIERVQKTDAQMRSPL